MKIFLAEDDSSIAAIAELALSKVGHHDATLFQNGQELVEALEGSIPDLVLLDVMMPVLNGFETFQKIKENENWKHVPILFLTAKAQAHEIHNGMKMGAAGYILKPFDPMTLSKEIEKIIRAHG